MRATGAVAAAATIEEAYAKAINATDMTMKDGQRSGADIITAAGMVRNRLGVALLRLRAEWDSVAVPDFSRYTDKNAYNSDMILLFGSLKTWREARQRTHDLADMLNISTVTADRVLWYFLDDVCDACEGRGYQVVEGARRLSDKQCPACHGTGRVSPPGGEAGKRLLMEMEDYAYSAGRAMGKKLR